MRDLKFRAWDGEDMIYPNHRITGNISNGDLLQKWPATIMQYTGLKDKNDKVIYEGDIVRSGMTGAEYLIFWHDENCSFRKQCVNANKSDIDIWQDASSQNIIGNIYENPDLLEEL